MTTHGCDWGYDNKVPWTNTFDEPINTLTTFYITNFNLDRLESKTKIK